MTFDEAGDQILSEIRTTFEKLLEILADPLYLNSSGTLYSDLLFDYEKLSEELFQIKVLKRSLEERFKK